MTTFYSHANINIDGRKSGTKLLKVHTEGVMSNSRQLLGNINPSTENCIELLDQIIRFHDLGKYTPHFQNYLLEKGKFDRKLKQHARFGAFTLFENLKQKGFLTEAFLACYIIIHHHSNLSDFSLLKRLVEQNGDDQYIFEQQWKSIRDSGPDYINQIKVELSEPRLTEFENFPEGKQFRKSLNDFLSVQSRIEVFFTINYLFSLLIEADKLDASNTKIYNRKPIAPNLVDDFLSMRSDNPLRTLVRKSVIERLSQLDLTEQKIFTLTAPTGVGKTFIALDVALKLRHQVPALKNAQIVYRCLLSTSLNKDLKNTKRPSVSREKYYRIINTQMFLARIQLMQRKTSWIE